MSWGDPNGISHPNHASPSNILLIISLCTGDVQHQDTYSRKWTICLAQLSLAVVGSVTIWQPYRSHIVGSKVQRPPLSQHDLVAGREPIINWWQEQGGGNGGAMVGAAPLEGILEVVIWAHFSQNPCKGHLAASSCDHQLGALATQCGHGEGWVGAPRTVATESSMLRSSP